MPLQIKVTQIFANSSGRFDFSDNIVAYTTGLTNFQVAFKPNTDHHVHEIGVKLTVTRSGNTLTVTPSFILGDTSGNSFDPSRTYVTVALFAWVGSDPGTVTLTTVQGVASGSSVSVPIAGNNPPILNAMLSGFQIAYPAGVDHHVNRINFNTQATPNGAVALVSGSGYMGDASGNTDVSCTLDIGVISSAVFSPGFEVFQAASVQFTSPSFTARKTVTAAGSVLVSFMAVYKDSDDHHLQALDPGADNTSIRDTSVTINNAAARMWDDSGNSQDNNLSSVTMLAIAAE